MCFGGGSKAQADPNYHPAPYADPMGASAYVTKSVEPDKTAPAASAPVDPPVKQLPGSVSPGLNVQGM